MKAYINGIGAVLSQEISEKDLLLANFVERNEKYLSIVPPDYKEYIDPRELRRMSKIVRMGIVAAKTALKDAGIDNPDAILTATGMGCQADTEKFLNGMIDEKETLLNPTAFIQSTHNTSGAQIALMLGNNNYNLTYVHRTFSFESALLDSLMLINEKKTNNILLGGIDEITEESWLIKTKIGYYKNRQMSNLELKNDILEGALAGEGTAFFILSPEKTENTYASITGVKMIFRPKSETDLIKKIEQFLTEKNLTKDDLDLIIFGYNGDRQFDSIYTNLETNYFNNSSNAYYKHICGEFDTSSAVATWLAARIMKENHIPEIMIAGKKNNRAIKKILLYNQFRNVNHSLILLENANL